MRRRELLRLAGLVPAATLATWLAACDPDPEAEPAPDEARGPGPIDLVVVRTGAGLALVDASHGRIVAGPTSGVNAANGYAFATAALGARTTVDVRRSTGRPLYQSNVDGSWLPRVISPDGALVALADAPAPSGRRQTTLVVADARGERGRWVLPGNLEPEAFSAVRDYLYLLDYLPPEAPDSYRVRALNLATGEVVPLVTRDKQVIPPGAEETMRGEGRQAVYAPRQEYLFTLYTHQPDHDHTRDIIAARSSGVHAFVHSLNLTVGFAYCIDLPSPFGESPADGHVIALAPSSDDPVVIDTSTGTVAELNGIDLTIRRTVAIEPLTATEPAFAVLNGLLFLARGPVVRGLRPEGYGLVHTWPMPEAVRGLGLSVDRERLWIGQPGGLLAIEVSTGRQVASIAVPDLVAVESVGAN